MSSVQMREIVQSLACCLGAVLVAAACTGSTVVDEVGAAATAPPGAVATVKPTAVAADAPAATPVLPGTPAPTAEPTEPAATPVPIEPPLPARADSLLGVSPDGRFAYAGTTSPWNTATPCGSAPFEALAVIDVAQSTNSDAVVYGAGLDQGNDVRQLAFDGPDRMAILSSCHQGDDRQFFLQRADLLPSGEITFLGPLLDLNATENSSDPYLLRWRDDDTVEMRVIVETDPDDFDSWVVERRVVSVVDGTVHEVESDGYDEYFEDYGRDGTPYTSPDRRFIYRQVEDPGGSLGCEGSGTATTIEVDDGSTRRLALGTDGLVFAVIERIHFGPDGLIAWTSGCEGFTTAYVGRIRDDGTIADAHSIDTYALEDLGDLYAEYQHFALSDDGFLVALGGLYDGNTAGTIKLFRYDLATDPQFVETSDPAPVVEVANPLASTLEGNGSWYSGETLATEGACGASTLYGETTTGLVRAFPTGTELDTVVDIDVSETRTLTFEPGSSFDTRTIVLSTACPESYDGRRIWFGIEPERVRFGLFLEQADLGETGEVAQVLSVREFVAPGTTFAEALFAEVELLDGSVTEIELKPQPLDP